MSCEMSTTSLVYWQDPILTGAVFGSVLTALISLCYCSLLSVTAYSALALLTAVGGIKLYSFVMVKAGKAMQDSDPLACVSSVKLSVPEEAIRDHSGCIAGTINFLLSKARSLFLVENPVDTLKFGLCLYVLTYVGAWFNALTLVTMAWVAIFTLPKLYLNNQPQVDEVIAKVKAQVDEIKDKVIEALPANMKPAVVKKED